PPPPPPPELPPPQPSVSGWSFNDLDQVAAFLTYTAGTQHSLWFYQAGDGWTKVAEIGTALQLSPLPAPAVQVSTIGYVHDSGGSDGKPTGLSNAGELVFSINGSHVVSARVVAPDITVESGTDLTDEYIPHLKKHTNTGRN